MTHEEKDRMLNKYKYGLNHGGKIMNDEEANRAREEEERTFPIVKMKRKYTFMDDIHLVIKSKSDGNIHQVMLTTEQKHQIEDMILSWNINVLSSESVVGIIPDLEQV